MRHEIAAHKHDKFLRKGPPSDSGEHRAERQRTFAEAHAGNVCTRPCGKKREHQKVVQTRGGKSFRGERCAICPSAIHNNIIR